jgi:KDO2-lipid IV(A) lauroyltransferase
MMDHLPSLDPQESSLLSSMKKGLRYKIEFFPFYGFIKVIRLLPYSIAEKSLIVLFIFVGKILGIRRRVAYQNLKRVFPDKDNDEIRKMLHGMYVNLAKNCAEIFVCGFEGIQKKIDIEGWDNLIDALSLKKGVLLASAHMGNWELAGAFLSRKSPLAIIYKKIRNPHYDDFVNRNRRQNGIIILDKKDSLRPVLKLLKQNYIITILVDQNAGRKGVETDFLGSPASTFIGVAKISVMTGVPIVPAVAVRHKNGGHRLIFEKPIYPDNYDKSEISQKLLTEKASKQIEKNILRYPEQWFWVHRRWRGAGKARKIRQ